MERSFTCVNKLCDDNTGPLYITDKEHLEKITDTHIYLRCFVDDFFLAIKEFEEVKGKIINYYVKIWENIIIDNYENMFNTFDELKKHKNNILGLEINLTSKVKESDFEKLTIFLKGFTHGLDFRINLGNIEVFSKKQLNILKNINSNLDIKLNINQLYEGKYSECYCDNSYAFEELIEIKEKVDEIKKKIPDGLNDIEKVLFLYKYLGKKVKYDKRIANKDERQLHDSKSIYDVLFNNKGVCSSFAIAFKALMDATNIECQVVISDNHAWNVVKINGYWYHLDLTWDLYNIKHNMKLEYFLKSERYMLKENSHQIYTYYADEKDIAGRSISIRRYKKNVKF